ncbi:uncharacterized protein IL334_002038 [Kwoniella shivajii]|uniref:Gfd2/YDR514C-like C-terminal domain-containing protein n=1 Tax=Kwoniella shivajii TaxID=564305 RepID=A0ABZ1CTM2_9TREE|nr:hypothetical protein IL334_002038 [Kwoniella shivajii]
MYKYTEKLSSLHANAMSSLINGHSLVHPDHPLHKPGEDGITLYIGIDKIGKPRLFFSLHQIQYLQYYIHEMRLTTPSWAEYHNNRTDLLFEGKEEEADQLEIPSLEEGKDDWVPLPSILCKARDLVSVEPITINSNIYMKEIYKRVTKDGKTAERYARNGLPVPEFDPKRFEAIKDNITPGPGLRKGPERQGRNHDRVEEAAEGTGWGGFPLVKEKDHSKDADDSAPVINRSPPENDFDGGDQDHPPTPSTPFIDLGMSYFYHCQRAFILAISGGLLASLPDTQRPAPGEEDDEGPMSLIPPEIGRSLFISLAVTRYEKDPSVLLEVGYSAIWWQKIPQEIERKEGEANMDYEEMRDSGHFIIQEHILDKKNGEVRPDYRDGYLFGDSLPLQKDKIRSTIKQKIKELSVRAGNGPIYIVNHTAEGEVFNFKDIGFDISLTSSDLQPDGWEVPPYMCAAGCGSVFIVNTATLYGSVENVPSKTVDAIQYAGRTRKSLQHTALLVFGQDQHKIPHRCGNAGNDAFYTLVVFLDLMSGLTLPELREEYARAQLLLNGESLSLADSNAKIVQTVPLTPIPSTDQDAPTPDPEPEYDSDDGFMEDDMIQGIFYEDEKGNLVEMDDDW